MHEIEIQLAFKDKEELKKKLESLGAKLTRQEIIEDNYFSQESKSLKDAKRFLRIRKKGDFSEITYKGEVESTGDIEKRIELNCEIKDSNAMNQILDNLNFNNIRKNKSTRDYYEFEDLEIVIVDIIQPVILQHMEIEGESVEEIQIFREKLGDLVFQLPQDHFKEIDTI